MSVEMLRNAARVDTLACTQEEYAQKTVESEMAGRIHSTLECDAASFVSTQTPFGPQLSELSACSEKADQAWDMAEPAVSGAAPPGRTPTRICNCQRV